MQFGLLLKWIRNRSLSPICFSRMSFRAGKAIRHFVAPWVSISGKRWNSSSFISNSSQWSMRVLALEEGRVVDCMLSLSRTRNQTGAILGGPIPWNAKESICESLISIFRSCVRCIEAPPLFRPHPVLSKQFQVPKVKNAHFLHFVGRERGGFAQKGQPIFISSARLPRPGDEPGPRGLPANSLWPLDLSATRVELVGYLHDAARQCEGTVQRSGSSRFQTSQFGSPSPEPGCARASAATAPPGLSGSAAAALASAAP